MGTDWTRVDVLTMLGLSVALVALVWQVRALRGQFALQTFADYTKRYQELVSRLPSDVYNPDFDLSLHRQRDDIIGVMRLYFDLCSEERFAYCNGWISRSIWEEWRQGMSIASSRPVVQQALAALMEDEGFRTGHAELCGEFRAANRGPWNNSRGPLKGLLRIWRRLRTHRRREGLPSEPGLPAHVSTQSTTVRPESGRSGQQVGGLGGGEPPERA